MGFLRNIKTSIDDKSSMSVNNVTVLASAIIGAIIGLVVCFVLVFDVTYDGKIDTDLGDLGWFLLAGGGYIMGSGLPKAYVDGKMKTRAWVENEKMQIEAEEDVEDYRVRRRKKKKKYPIDEDVEVENEDAETSDEG